MTIAGRSLQSDCDRLEGVLLGQMSFIISILGVLIFAGLTAWDTQKLKRDWLNRVQYSGQEIAEKSAIMGALTLYLDFINLFLFILQFMGRRD